MKNSQFNDDGHMIDETLGEEVWNKTAAFCDDLINSIQPVKIDALLLETMIRGMIEIKFGGYRLRNARTWAKKDASIT